MPLNDQHVRSLLLACRETNEEEIDCEQFLSLMAEYVEARATGEEAKEAFAKVRAHERLCANCAEECRALAEVISET